AEEPLAAVGPVADPLALGAERGGDPDLRDDRVHDLVDEGRRRPGPWDPEAAEVELVRLADVGGREGAAPAADPATRIAGLGAEDGQAAAADGAGDVGEALLDHVRVPQVLRVERPLERPADPRVHRVEGSAGRLREDLPRLVRD